MTVLVSQYVRLGEWATLRAKARLQFIEEVQVKIDLLVYRTVERPDGSGSISTTRLRCPREKHRLGFFVYCAPGAKIRRSRRPGYY